MDIKLFFLSVFVPVLLLFSGCAEKSLPAETVPLPPDVRKCIAAPFVEGKISFDGIPDEEVWKKAEFFSDFDGPVPGVPSEGRTHARIFHDGEYLYLALTCFDRKKDLTLANGHPMSLWGADRVEFFLGGLEPEPNLVQYVWGPGTARYGACENWEAKCHVADEYWTSETRIKLSSLCLENSVTGITLIRECVKKKQASYLTPVRKSYQCTPHYADLIIGSYELAAQLKFNRWKGGKLSRRAYELLNAEKSLPRHRIVRGPWLFNANTHEMSIAWCTAGKTGALLEYRLKGEKEFIRLRSADDGLCWDKDRKIHKVTLKDLIPGKEYEYRIGNLDKDEKNPVFYPAGDKLYSFKQYGKKDLTFLVMADVHGDGISWKKFLDSRMIREKCDLIVNIGDMLSSSSGTASIFSGFLDAQLGFAAEKPLLNFRGNHEQTGLSPRAFFDVFASDGFKGFGLYRFGDVCLIGLDVDNPYQRKWLEEAVKSPRFLTAKHRILLAHYPLLKRYERRVLQEINGILTGKDAPRIDLLLSGHMHRGYFAPANSQVAHSIVPGKTHPAISVPFASLCNEGPGVRIDNTALLVEVKGASITVACIDRNGKTIRSFQIK